jgi:hypothetical protein
MPFKLRKVPKKDLYWVVDDKGKHYSKEGLPKDRAKEQMKALYAAEGRGEMKGKGKDCGCGGGSKDLEAMAEHYSGGGLSKESQKKTKDFLTANANKMPLVFTMGLLQLFRSFKAIDKRDLTKMIGEISNVNFEDDFETALEALGEIENIKSSNELKSLIEMILTDDPEDTDEAPPTDPIEGAGILDFAKKLISKGKDVVRNVLHVSDKGLRKDLPPKARATLRKYANWNIMGITIRRDPIQSALNTALNAISIGAWERMKKVLNYDNLFHLGLEMDVRLGKRTVRLLLEKNEVINLGPLKARDNDTEVMHVDMKGQQPRLDDFIEKARQAMGDRFIPYDPFYNNCQDFILGVLRANNMANENEATFIKQPIEKLIQGIPEFAPKVAKAVTDLGGVVNNVLEGEGKLDLKTGMFHRPIKPLTGGRISAYTERRLAQMKEYGKLSPEKKAEADKAAQAEIERRYASAAERKQTLEERDAYNAEMKRRRESGFAPIVDALVKAGDIGVKYIAPVVGVPKVVTEAYKAFAPRGSEFYSGSGNVVTMKKKDFIKEHKKLIKLFNKITAEGKEQKAELKKMTGGGPMGSSIRRINKGMKGKVLPLAIDVATTIAENRTNPLGLISGLAEVAQSHADANVRGGKKKQEIIFRSLEPSTRKGKKWTVNLSVDGKHRMVHFGAVQNGKPMSDYTIHKDKSRMEDYTRRHRAREDWTKSGILTPGFWAKHLLWAKPSLNASLADIRKRFKI